MKKLSFLLPLLLLVSLLPAAENPVVGTVVSMNGDLKVKRFTTGCVYSLSPGAVLYANDQIWFTTSKSDRVTLQSALMTAAPVTIQQTQAPILWNPENNTLGDGGGTRPIQVIINPSHGGGQQGQ